MAITQPTIERDKEGGGERGSGQAPPPPGSPLSHSYMSVFMLFRRRC